GSSQYPAAASAPPPKFQAIASASFSSLSHNLPVPALTHDFQEFEVAFKFRHALADQDTQVGQFEHGGYAALKATRNAAIRMACLNHHNQPQSGQCGRPIRH
ncbi:MAG: hypothetical protein LBH10_00780, partial [Burkholderiaceae bacterium]|nr:hypothetical protein [Burkholderiaceae bacterium]